MKRFLLFSFFLSFSLTFSQNNSNTDRQALIALYNSTNGASWKYKWDLSKPVDDWYGVTVNAEGRVTKLLLGFDNNLDGELPSEIGLLDKVTDMVMYGNAKLNGSIPPELGNLSSAIFINLSSNNLSGSLPKEIGQLAELQRLYLNGNHLFGEFPSEITGMVSLSELNLASNEFSELSGVLSGLPNLYNLDLSYNDFSGPIPNEFGNFQNIGILNLGNNNLVGPIPQSFENLETLRKLDLIFNRLEGEFLSQLSGLSSLQELYLRQNQFSGELDARIGNMAGLRVLRLGGNFFSGPLPLELFILSDLVTLSLDSNGFSGYIPPELGNLTSLQNLYFTNNNFYGDLPSELSQLTILRQLNLGGNDFEGNFPIEVTTMGNLETLYLYDNNFVGSIPEEIINLRNLKRAVLNGNLFVGDIPLFYENIEYIDISNNVFTEGNMEYLLNNQENTNVYYYGPVQIIHEPQKEHLFDSNEVRGNVRFDILNNGCSKNDTGVRYLKMLSKSENDSIITFTSTDGFYRFGMGEGIYETSIIEPLPNYFSISPDFQETSFIGIGNQEDVSFCISSVESINDLNVSYIPIREARAGFNSAYSLIINNAGTIAKTGKVRLGFDASLSFLEATETPSAETSNSLEFKFENLEALETRIITIRFDIPPPPTVTLNDVLTFTALITPLEGDNREQDNTFVLEQTVIGSYDPNDITVLEGEEVHIDNAADYLNYVIRFQNTGTASAINVKIDHELDADLDWETFTPISSSHSNAITITDGKDVKFLFENINLPDSTANEPASHGHVAFKIKPKSDIAVGDTVEGTASIYFDFNPPIITNTVNTEFVDTEPLISTAFVVSPISCPTTNDAVIQVEANGGTEPHLYELLDGSSTVLILAQANKTFVNLGPGEYITKVIDNNAEESFFSITILEPLPIDTTFEVTDATCFGANNGQIQVVATNGTAPYNYSVNGVDYQTSNLFENLAPGQYIVETVDSNGCAISDIVEIVQPEPLTLSITITEISCKGLNDGGILTTASGGTSPYEYSLDGVSFSTNAEFIGLSPADYTVWSRDTNGCIISSQIVLLEPNNPDFDNDGIGDDCDEDIDGDGIANDLDECPETPLGTEVDAFGCAQFSLPSNNFSVQATGETCASSNNGSILVTALENLDYTAKMNYGTTAIDKDFRTFVAFQDLEAGMYEICIKVTGQLDFERCFTINITQPESLEVDAKVDTSGKSVNLKMKGGDNYTIDINDTLYHTTAEEISLPLLQLENNISVRTDKDCQGIFKEQFLLDVSGILVYPNPVVGDEVSVLIPNTVDKDVLLALYTNDGRMVLQQVEKTYNTPIKLNVNGFTSGIYTLKIEMGNNMYSRRIIIK